jgi:hypothetical protein
VKGTKCKGNATYIFIFFHTDSQNGVIQFHSIKIVYNADNVLGF